MKEFAVFRVSDEWSKHSSAREEAVAGVGRQVWKWHCLVLPLTVMLSI